MRRDGVQRPVREGDGAVADPLDGRELDLERAGVGWGLVVAGLHGGDVRPGAGRAGRERNAVE
jgi:hypothetical protein